MVEGSVSNSFQFRDIPSHPDSVSCGTPSAGRQIRAIYYSPESWCLPRPAVSQWVVSRVVPSCLWIGPNSSVFRFQIERIRSYLLATIDGQHGFQCIGRKCRIEQSEGTIREDAYSVGFVIA